MSLDVDQAFAKDVSGVWVLSQGVWARKIKMRTHDAAIRITKVCSAGRSEHSLQLRQ